MQATKAVARLGASFLTVHAVDEKTMTAAVEGRGDSSSKAAWRHGHDQS